MQIPRGEFGICSAAIWTPAICHLSTTVSMPGMYIHLQQCMYCTLTLVGRMLVCFWISLFFFEFSFSFSLLDVVLVGWSKSGFCRISLGGFFGSLASPFYCTLQCTIASYYELRLVPDSNLEVAKGEKNARYLVNVLKEGFTVRILVCWVCWMLGEKWTHKNGFFEYSFYVGGADTTICSVARDYYCSHREDITYYFLH